MSVTCEAFVVHSGDFDPPASIVRRRRKSGSAATATIPDSDAKASVTTVPIGSEPAAVYARTFAVWPFLCSIPLMAS
jgi:hypothetical protein